MTYEQIVNAPTAASVRALLESGLTVRDVAELMRADPRAVDAMLSQPCNDAPPRAFPKASINWTEGEE